MRFWFRKTWYFRFADVLVRQDEAAAVLGRQVEAAAVLVPQDMVLPFRCRCGSADGAAAVLVPQHVTTYKLERLRFWFRNTNACSAMTFSCGRFRPLRFTSPFWVGKAVLVRHCEAAVVLVRLVQAAAVLVPQYSTTSSYKLI